MRKLKSNFTDSFPLTHTSTLACAHAHTHTHTPFMYHAILNYNFVCCYTERLEKPWCMLLNIQTVN